MSTHRKNPFFSVIIPSYNYANFLPNTIESILNQSFDDFELIVINDGSTDNTDEIMQYYSEKEPKIKYINQKNQGVAETRNRGIKIAQGQYVYLFDSDDIMLKNALDIFHKSIIKKPEASVYIAQYYTIKENDKRKERCLWSLGNTKEENFKKYILSNDISMLCSSIIFKKTAFDHYLFPKHIPQSEDEAVFGYMLANYNAVKVPEFVAERIKHDEDSLRTKVYPNLPELLSNELFNSKLIPSSLLRYKKKYKALKHLEEFRTLFLKRDYTSALEEYNQALALNKKAALKFNYLRKAIKSWIKK